MPPLPPRYISALTLLTTFAAIFLFICAHRIGILFPATHKIPAPLLINLNKDDARTIALLPTIGLDLAEKVVASRWTQGPYTSLDSLLRVPGVTSGTLQRIAPYTTLAR